MNREELRRSDGRRYRPRWRRHCSLQNPSNRRRSTVSALAAPTSLQAVVDVAAAVAAAPVRLAGVSKTIDGRPILTNIDLDVPRGEFLAVLGANGAGKSTLLKIIATL